MFSFFAMAVPAPTAPDARTLAYVARVYSTSPRVKTGYAVFVCEPDGKNPKRISAAKEGFDSLCWVGKTRLVWLGTPSNLGDVEVWTSVAPFNRASLLTRVSGLSFYRPEMFLPSSGRPMFTMKGKDGVFTVDEATGLFVKADPGKFAFRELLSDPANDGKPFQFKPPVATQWTLNLALEKQPDGSEEYRGTSVNLDMVKRQDFAEHLSRLIWQEQEGKVWMVGSLRDSTIGWRYSLWGFEWGSGALKPVCQNAGEIDFWPGRSAYAFTTAKELTELGEGQGKVWTNQLWVGDLTSGTKERLFGGNIHFSSVALRDGLPPKPDDSIGR